MSVKFMHVEEARDLALRENMYKNVADRYIKDLRDKGWNISYSESFAELKIVVDLLRRFLCLSEPIDTGDVQIRITSKFDVVPGSVLVDHKASFHDILVYIKS